MQRLIHKYTNPLTLVSFILILFAFIITELKDVFLMIATFVAGVPISMKAFQKRLNYEHSVSNYS